MYHFNEMFYPLEFVTKNILEPAELLDCRDCKCSQLLRNDHARCAHDRLHMAVYWQLR